ncbi:NAD/NADP octopine/nopaline dehydrogenase family protein [candidate division CSSED10-310 bacterium]|uniref:NAD/NADP octopine/nopaline dehydrogenase family protein n=1 Tax=candidate division CSSED10-310 bacterium TaxID=2855610 RepID=A0ABV6YUN7_UNCC1
MRKFAVIGAGNAGSTLAAHLKLLGQEVSIYDVVESQLAPIIKNDNTVNLTGNIEVSGPAKIDLVTMDLAEAIAGAELIICTTPAHVHKFVAKDLAGCAQSGQILMLNPGRTGGVLEVRKVLQEQNCQADILVVESQSILYACRREEATIKVFGVKNRIPCAGQPEAEINRFFEIIQTVFPQFVPAEHGIWTTSLDNIGMLFHPTPTIMNLGRMESGLVFDYYIDGFSPTIAHMVEKLDAERLQVAAAIGIKLPTVVEWLETNYNAVGDDLYQALQNNDSYRGIRAPVLKGREAKLGLRYVIEDVPSGLVPFSELGKKFGVPTPAMDTIINLANILFETDFRAKGRNLAQLGLDTMTVEDIRKL